MLRRVDISQVRDRARGLRSRTSSNLSQNMKPASRVIAIEEAFVHLAVWKYYSEDLKRRFAPIFDRLSDVGPKRIRIMDAAGIDMQVLSHVQPGVQIIKDEDAPFAIAASCEVNDWLGEIVKTYPSRFGGFATLPTQSPLDAADELERTVKKLGFKGALINGHTNGRYWMMYHSDLCWSVLSA
jgi:predicted TIM-barrel fold metal-dependent hydrolase